MDRQICKTHKSRARFGYSKTLKHMRVIDRPDEDLSTVFRGS